MTVHVQIRRTIPYNNIFRAMPEQFQRPENALKRAQEFLELVDIYFGKYFLSNK